MAQWHVAFLRLHNRLVDLGNDFEEARRLTRFHYQWLVLNAFLPAICAGDVVDEVLATGAPLYAEFLAANPPADPARMPMPLEFSVAGFRFGHSMVRGGYDHNRFFGTAAAGSAQILRSARRIDTHLAPPLDDMINQPATPAVMKRLAMRNLRRGYRLNIPSAQGLIQAINATGLYRPILP